jgi:hypothetical protein
MTTDTNEVSNTPRTDAARERYYDGKTSDWVHYTICGMIEQELAASQAEVERLESDKAHLIAYCANLLEAANLLQSLLNESLGGSPRQQVSTFRPAEMGEAINGPWPAG